MDAEPRREAVMQMSSETQPQEHQRITQRRRDNMAGILRLDIGKSRAGSGSSAEFSSVADVNGQATPGACSRPSPDRLSVKFVLDEKGCDCHEEEDVFTPGSPRGQLATPGMEKVRFSRETTVTDGEEEEVDDDDYSASACVIMQRRASSRRGSRRRSRRPSSPFPADLETLHALDRRRRSSVFTTSSGDTAITMDEGVTQEQIYENMRLHKEVLGNVKYQAWGMRKKMRLVHQAKAYIKRHEGELQERLAQSRTTRDLLQRFHIELGKRWHQSKREMANIATLLIPWELRVKEIECHFGSVVASYFTFLRWMFWVNLVIAVMLVAFVIIPEVLTANKESAGVRKIMLPEEEAKSTNLMTLWNFEGVLKYSPIFYGYYTDRSDYDNGKGYRLPFAYFMTGLAVYTYSFVAILRRMATNSRMSKLSEKGDECIFTWKLFTGWDYMIGNAETAHNRMASIILGFKEALLEEAERKRNSRNWKVISLRVLVNVTVMMLLVASAYLVVDVVNRSTEPQDTWWGQNETTIIMTFVSFIFPIIFELIGLLECYHPRKQLRVQLARIMVLNLLNLYSLIFAQFGNISKMTLQLEQLKAHTSTTPATHSKTQTSKASTPTAHNIAVTTTCTRVAAKCSVSPADVVATALAAMLLASATTTARHSSAGDTRLPPALAGLAAAPQRSTAAHDPRAAVLVTSAAITDPPEYANLVLVTTDTRPPADSETQLSSVGPTVPQGTAVDTPGVAALLASTTATTGTSEQPLILNTTTDTYTHSATSSEVVSDTGEGVASTTLDLSWTTDTSAPEDTTEDMTSYSLADGNYEEIDEAVSDTDYISSPQPDLSFSEDSGTNPATEESTETTGSGSKAVTTATDDVVTFPSSNDDVVTYPSSSDDVFTFLSSSDDVVAFTSSSDDVVTFPSSVSVTATSADLATESGTPKEKINILSTPAVEVTDEICYVTKCVDETTPSVTTEPSKPSTKAHRAATVAATSRPGHHLGAQYLDIEVRRNLSRLCWETMFGQELVKLTVMDLVMTILSTLMMDFFRALLIRILNRLWCWDLEKQFPQYGDFKIAENILHLVNNQGMVWMGMFFSPGLPLINTVKLAIMMYLRSWATLTSNVPHEVVFRASRSNNFYFALLLTMLFLCVLPVGYAIVWVEPSWHCGPFSSYRRMYHIFTESLQTALPKSLHLPLAYIASPGIVIPFLVLLVLIIYYLASLTGALREANNDLKMQLRRERTEERRKMFQLVGRRQRGADTPFGRWRRILPDLPAKPAGNPGDKDAASSTANGLVRNDANTSELLARLMKRALRESLATSEDESVVALDGDAELQDSLPDDLPPLKVTRPVLKAKERQDSLTSCWSSDIPEIRISGANGGEALLHGRPPPSPHREHVELQDLSSSPVEEKDTEPAQDHKQ